MGRIVSDALTGKRKGVILPFFSPDVLYFYTNILRQEKFRTKNLRAKLLMHMHTNYFIFSTSVSDHVIICS